MPCLSELLLHGDDGVTRQQAVTTLRNKVMLLLILLTFSAAHVVVSKYILVLQWERSFGHAKSGIDLIRSHDQMSHAPLPSLRRPDALPPQYSTPLNAPGATPCEIISPNIRKTS